MKIYLGRQPILNKDKETVGYELLYRSGEGNVFPSMDSTEATTKVLHHLFTALGLDEVAHGKQLFINFDARLLLSELPDFGYKNIVFEILEDVEVSNDLVDACKRLVGKGFRLALDDFILTADMAPLLEIASIVKIDWLATPCDKIEKLVMYLSRYNLTLLAEKIEDEEAFKRALGMGFELFQGFFFARPEILHGKTVEVSSFSRMHILEVLNRPDAEVDDIAEVISQDVSIVYKLLKIINSSLYSLRKEVTSVKDAVVLLGLQEIKRWLFVLVVSELGSDSPQELVNLAVVRAIFGQSLARYTEPDLADEVFLAGLFSLLDVMFNMPFEDFLSDLPVSAHIKDALLKQEGPVYPYLELCIAYERSDMDNVDRLAELIGIDNDTMTICYSANSSHIVIIIHTRAYDRIGKGSNILLI
jgi:EAL and modified HD-GYP domain-containing signal transduction protein